MEATTCALCNRPILANDRIILLGIERLLFHGACYDAASGCLAARGCRPRTLESLRFAFRRARSA